MKLSILENTVSSKEQLLPSSTARYFEVEDPKLKIGVVGNSILCHGVLESIGWHNEWGMAASCEENDFFHLLMNDFRKTHPNTSFLRIQAAEWERTFWAEPEDYPAQLKALYEFDADVIIFRIAENCSKESCEEHDFKKGFSTLCEHFSRDGKCKLIITDSFWRSPWTEEGIHAVAEKYCGSAIKLGDLGDMDEMKAIGLFEHRGVAHHPGDKGMRAIADRILERLYEVVK